MQYTNAPTNTNTIQRKVKQQKVPVHTQQQIWCIGLKSGKWKPLIPFHRKYANAAPVF